MELTAIVSNRNNLIENMSLILDHDFSTLNGSFNRIKISSYEHIVESKGSSFFSLQLFEINASEELVNTVTHKLESLVFKRSFFVLSSCLSHWVPTLLAHGAFDVMIGPMRSLEFMGKLEYFFSDSYQTYLLKNNTNFHLELTKKEQQLFDFLMANPKGVTREQLMTICWKNISVHPKTLDVHLFNLRQKLESVGGSVNFRNGSWYLHFSSQNFNIK